MLDAAHEADAFAHARLSDTLEGHTPSTTSDHEPLALDAYPIIATPLFGMQSEHEAGYYTRRIEVASLIVVGLGTLYFIAQFIRAWLAGVL